MKRDWKVLRTKDWGGKCVKKEACMWLKTLRASLQQNDKKTVDCEEGLGGSAVVTVVMSHYTSWIK
jgi:hypothetical protein